MSQLPTNNSQSNQSNPTNSFPNREAVNQANAHPSTEASSRRSRLSGGGGISHSSHSRESHPDNDLTTLRANLKSLVLKNLLASPFLTRFYLDSVIQNFPNSNEAKILARNYQEIIDRITMPNPKSCTHIKVTGARCDSPALRGEQFCYFHQHAHRGVRRPARSRLHPIALIESEEAIQASLMEVINGLLRNTLDVKRAELILRALHIAVKNARNVKFDSKVYPKVREIPEYAEPATENLETMDHAGTVAIVRAAGKASELVMKPARSTNPCPPSLPCPASQSIRAIRIVSNAAKKADACWLRRKRYATPPFVWGRTHSSVPQAQRACLKQMQSRAPRVKRTTAELAAGMLRLRRVFRSARTRLRSARQRSGIRTVETQGSIPQNESHQ